MNRLSAWSVVSGRRTRLRNGASVAVGVASGCSGYPRPRARPMIVSTIGLAAELFVGLEWHPVDALGRALSAS